MPARLGRRGRRSLGTSSERLVSPSRHSRFRRRSERAAPFCNRVIPALGAGATGRMPALCIASEASAGHRQTGRTHAPAQSRKWRAGAPTIAFAIRLARGGRSQRRRSDRPYRACRPAERARSRSPQTVRPDVLVARCGTGSVARPGPALATPRVWLVCSPRRDAVRWVRHPEERNGPDPAGPLTLSRKAAASSTAPPEPPEQVARSNRSARPARQATPSSPNSPSACR